jgi:hypothetical protein
MSFAKNTKHLRLYKNERLNRFNIKIDYNGPKPGIEDDQRFHRLGDGIASGFTALAVELQAQSALD